jgi:hypothetical protein
MEKEEKPWHQLVMVCPTCGASFCPEVLGLHVRLCPQCEEKKAAYEEKFATSLKHKAACQGKPVLAG